MESIGENIVHIKICVRIFASGSHIYCEKLSSGLNVAAVCSFFAEVVRIGVFVKLGSWQRDQRHHALSQMAGI